MTSNPRTPTPSPQRTAKPQGSEPARRAHYRERDVGVGYGNSSGYAARQCYVRDWTGQPSRFRCG